MQRASWFFKQFTVERLMYRYRQLRNLTVDSKVIWDQTVEKQTEVEFFESVIAKIDSDSPPPMKQRLQPNRELADKITTMLDPEPDSLKILDIGAGPLSTLGTVWEGNPVDVTAIDPFAESYNALWEEYGYEPPVQTQTGQGEKIDQLFLPESFDIVHSQNALDHTYNPLLILKKAMKLIKPSGWIMLFHKENEGKRVYNDFHQWNLTEEDGNFIIWKMGKRYNVANHLNHVRQMITERRWSPGLGCDVIETYIQKQS